MTLTHKSKEALKRSKAKEERDRDGTKAMLEYEAEGRAVLKKTERLRALRLAKEATEKNEEVAREPIKPVSPTRMVRSTS
jgi:hypothetical protein